MPPMSRMWSRPGDRRRFRPRGARHEAAHGAGAGPAGRTGLDYLQQRYYDPQTGTFLSPDPVDVDTSTGANFNRYAYANDNPYRFTDPDGRDSCSTGTHLSGQSCASLGVKVMQ